MKKEDLRYLESVQIRYRYSEEDYGSSRGEIIGTFLAVVEHKNCVLNPEARNVVLAGKVHDFLERWESRTIWTEPIVKIEHMVLPRCCSSVAERIKAMFSDEAKALLEDRMFVPMVTTEDGIYMLGGFCQAAIEFMDGTNWAILQGRRGMRSNNPYGETPSNLKSFKDFKSYFTDVNEDYEPFMLE